MKIKKHLNKLAAALLLGALAACFEDISKYGKMKVYDPQGQKRGAFTFYVDEDYVRANEKSKKDPKNPQMTKAETKLLTSLLKKNQYCFY